jgi:hypothetical protein
MERDGSTYEKEGKAKKSSVQIQVLRGGTCRTILGFSKKGVTKKGSENLKKLGEICKMENQKI